MNPRFPLSLSDVFGVLGIAGITYSVVKDATSSVSTALGAAVVVAFFGVMIWAIYRAAPKREERFKLVVSHGSEESVVFVREAEESILVTHFTRDLPSREYTAAMLARLEKGVPVTRIVSSDVAQRLEVKEWLLEFKKHPKYRECIYPRPALPFEFILIDEKLVVFYLPTKNDPLLLNTALVFQNERLAGSVYTMFEGMRSMSPSPPEDERRA